MARTNDGRESGLQLDSYDSEMNKHYMISGQIRSDRGMNCGDIILFVRWNIMELGTNSWFQL